MSEFLDHSVEFTLGPIGDLSELEQQIDPPLRSMAAIAMMAVNSEGVQSYDAHSFDFPPAVPDSKEVDTPVSAGRGVVDLLRSIHLAHQSGALTLIDDSWQRNDPASHKVRTTLIAPLGLPQGRIWGEILGSSRYERPIQSVAVEYVQERDHSGVPLDVTTIRMAATLNEYDLGSQVRMLFCNVSVNDGRDFELARAHRQRLTVSTGQLENVTFAPPDRPPSFHYHVRGWAQGLKQLADTYGQ